MIDSGRPGQRQISVIRYGLNTVAGSPGLRPGLPESIINQIQYVQACVCANVGRGAGLPATMILLCLMTELGHGPNLLEETAHTRTHAPTLSPKPAPTPTRTPVLTPTPTPTPREWGFL
jgi:hypothetical protein